MTIRYDYKVFSQMIYFVFINFKLFFTHFQFLLKFTKITCFNQIRKTATMDWQSMVWFGNFASVFEISFFQNLIQFFFEFFIFFVIFVTFEIGKQMFLNCFIWIFILASFTFDFQIIIKSRVKNGAWRFKFSYQIIFGINLYKIL